MTEDFRNDIEQKIRDLQADVLANKAFSHNEAEHSRLVNLIIRNVSEWDVPDKDVIKYAMEFFNQEILSKIAAADIPQGIFENGAKLVPADISTAHRLQGNPAARRNLNQPRAIIVAFTRLSVRNLIWRSKRVLKDLHAQCKQANKPLILLDEHHEPLYDRKLRYLYGVFMELKSNSIPAVLYPYHLEPKLKIGNAMFNVYSIPSWHLYGKDRFV